VLNEFAWRIARSIFFFIKIDLAFGLHFSIDIRPNKVPLWSQRKSR
jgi:hypothetical protein